MSSCSTSTILDKKNIMDEEINEQIWVEEKIAAQEMNDFLNSYYED